MPQPRTDVDETSEDSSTTEIRWRLWLPVGLVVVVVVVGLLVWSPWNTDEVEAAPSYRLTADSCARVDWAMVGDHWGVDSLPEAKSKPGLADVDPVDADGRGGVSCLVTVPLADADPLMVTVRLATFTDAVAADEWMSDADTAAELVNDATRRSELAEQGAGVAAITVAPIDKCESSSLVAFYPKADGPRHSWDKVSFFCRSANLVTSVQVTTTAAAGKEAGDLDAMATEFLAPLVADVVGFSAEH